ncbi:hypothetical protein QYE76_068672 [Lolium multiflorum]|uniref:RNase H type-1 domain-containing protein n=1 Tax=Lolium multiflorum TaxID=4521 RepID=A0AAD8WE64_LOLMU|nr:hypothetical protein QYE76_068672 [Lolium multiflorum]
MPCLAHIDPATGKSSHTNRNCKWVNDLKTDPEAGYKRARKHRPHGKGGKGKNKDKEEDSSEAMDEDDASPDPKEASAANKSNPFVKKSVGAYHTFLGTPTADHPAIIPKECYALVANSLGSIKLPVAFGDVNNFREEMITFEVVPLKSSYLLIFGRPTYHKFHARACYIYNKLKISGPNGMITVSEDYKKAQDCEEGEAAFAESVISGEELQGYRATVDPTEMQTTKKQISEQKNSFKAAIETKKHDLLTCATYQRTMQRCLKDQIGRNVHAYVDDIAVMTRKGSDLISDLTETFENLRRLRIAKEIGIKHIICCGDSDLVAQQVAGTWNARNSVMAAYRDEVDEIAKCFLGYEVKYVRRDDNTAADMLSKLGSGRKPIPPGVFLEHLRIPSVKGANPENPDMAVSPAKEVMATIPAWTQPFLDYLIDRKLPEDEVLARQITRRARSYTIVDGQLYKRSANGVFLKCVSNQDGIEILVRDPRRDCGHHAPRSLVAKALTRDFTG